MLALVIVVVSATVFLITIEMMRMLFKTPLRNPSRSWLSYLLLSLFLVLALLPFIGIIFTAFKSTSELANSLCIANPMAFRGVFF